MSGNVGEAALGAPTWGDRIGSPDASAGGEEECALLWVWASASAAVVALHPHNLRRLLRGIQFWCSCVFCGMEMEALAGADEFYRLREIGADCWVRSSWLVWCESQLLTLEVLERV